VELESYYDGVPGWGAKDNELTPVIKPGGSFIVRFTPPRAGTFMYHTHLNDEAQLSGVCLAKILSGLKSTACTLSSAAVSAMTGA
jgi:Multicopper oxidase